MTLNILLLIMMTLAALCTVMCRSLLKSTIGLAVTSAAVTMLMFRLDSPLAAVFELSVCTGLITVVFVSTISLTKPLTHKEILDMSRDRMKRFRYLPLAAAAACAVLFAARIKNDVTPAVWRTAITADARSVLWNFRQLDMFGQVLVLMIGALAVAILFKEGNRDER